MSIGNLPDNKLISLALQGYNPFQPDVGIFCGGYQGILYPNPTTLSYPDFDPYLHVDPTASPYTPGGHYNGLGVGNPGIDYKNPGHILGLLDTFARMSYGISVLQEIHTGGDGVGDINPVVNISIPLEGMTTQENSTIGIIDIYPSLTEIPTDWLDSFTVDGEGRVSPDPRPMASFSVGSGHTPSTNIVSALVFSELFAGKTVFSYIGMPQYLRTIIEALSSGTNSLTNKFESEFTLNSPHIFNNYSHQDKKVTGITDTDIFDFFADIDDLEDHELVSEGFVINQCNSLTTKTALKVLTGSDNYHDGTDGMNEYRSLTELNSVINLVPLQTIGATYWLDDHLFRMAGDPLVPTVDNWSRRIFFVSSYMISDFVINVSNISSDTVTINGTVTIKPIITNPEAYKWRLTGRQSWWPDFIPSQVTTVIYGPGEFTKKQANIEMSMTNDYTWDREWLGGGRIIDNHSFSDSFEDINYVEGVGFGPAGNSKVGFFPINANNLIVPFSKTFTLGVGCHSIRIRIFGRNLQMVTQGGTQMQPPETWDFTDTTFSNWLTDPLNVIDALEMSNIELSLTVGGTNFDTLIFNTSL